MIPMKKIDRIRELYFADGMSLIDISRKLRCCPNTVSKYVKVSDWNGAPKQSSRKVAVNAKIRAYDADMIALLKKERSGHYKQRITSKRIFELLKEMHPDYDCSYYLDTATSVNWGEYFKVLSVKTNAIPRCGIICEFPETLRDFILDADKKVRRAYMRAMHEVYAKSDFATAVTFADKMAAECVEEDAELMRRAGVE